MNNSFFRLALIEPLPTTVVAPVHFWSLTEITVSISLCAQPRGRGRSCRWAPPRAAPTRSFPSPPLRGPGGCGCLAASMGWPRSSMTPSPSTSVRSNTKTRHI